MIIIVILIGKTCSGKTTICKELVKKYGYKKVITYTTRPIRYGEVDGVDYHYITEEEFIKKINNNFFVEWKTYNTEFGVWYYGTALEDLINSENNSVIILTPNGFKEIKDKFGGDVFSIYIYANNQTIKSRLISRGDDEREAKRRISQDEHDFKGIENYVNRIIYNNEGTRIKDVIKKIVDFVREENKNE